MNEVSDAAPDSEIEEPGAQMRGLKEQKIELKQGKTLKSQKKSTDKKDDKIDGEDEEEGHELNSYRESEHSKVLEDDEWWF